MNVSYLKPPPREILFKIARNCSSKDNQNNTSSVIKKVSQSEFKNEENSRSYLSDSSGSCSSEKGDESSDNGSDYDAKKSKPKKSSTVKKQSVSNKNSSILALKES